MADFDTSEIDDKIADLKLRTHVGKKLDYGYFLINSQSISTNSNLSLTVENINDIEYIEDNKTIKLKAHVSYEISSGIFMSPGDSSALTFSFYNITEDCVIGPSSFYISSNYNSSWNDYDIDFIYTPKQDCEISLKCQHSYGGSSVNTGSVVIQEIGREVLINEVEEVAKAKHIEDTPVGHIMSVMALTAPPHYLICDGAEHKITDYPKLAEYFKNEFGAINYFGGDGTNTFAVPKNTDNIIFFEEINYTDSSHIANMSTSLINDFFTRTTNNKFVVLKNFKATIIGIVFSYRTAGSSTAEGAFYINDEQKMFYKAPEKTQGSTASSQIEYDFVKGDTFYFCTPSGNGYPKQLGTIEIQGSTQIKCIKYEPTYFMNYSPMYGGFNETVLFEGEANAAGKYSLNDNCNNYEAIYVYAGNGGEYNQCLLLKSVNNYSTYNIINNTYPDEDRRLIFGINNNTLNIAYSSGYSGHFGIEKIIGIKANSNTIIKNDDESIVIDKITYTDDEINSAVNNITGGDTNE